MRSDQFDSLPKGKEWLEIDLSSAIKGADGSGPTQTPGPTEGLKVLEKTIGAEEVGKESVDGVSTTRYRGTLPEAEVFGVTPDISDSRIDVWIDAKDRVRRIEIALTSSLKEGGPSTTTEATFDYVEFGREPTISPPPPDKVYDATAKVESAVQSAAE